MLVPTDPRRRRLWHWSSHWWSWLVVGLAILIVAFFALAFFPSKAGGTHANSSPNQGTWHRYGLTGTNFKAVDALTANDAWAGGTDGMLAHWDGTAWAPADNSGFVGKTVYDVDLLAPNTGWAAIDGGVFLKYDGQAWAHDTSHVLTATMHTISMVSTTNGWAGGENGFLAHYDGQAWNQVLPGGTLTSTIWGLDMVDANDGWLVTGTSDQSGMVGRLFRWNGTAWQEYLPRAARTLYAVDMLNANEGWAVGSGGLALRWNGTTWAEQPAPTAVALVSVQVRGQDDVWAAGYSVGGGSGLVHWNGTWSSFSVPTEAGLGAVSIISDADVWAVGERGTIIRYNGTEWTLSSGYPDYRGFFGVDATGPNDMWAVGYYSGSSRGLHHWDGSTWTPYSAPPIFEEIRDIDMLAPDQAWAVGRFGHFLKWNGVEWATEPGPSGGNAIELSMVSPTDGWAIGFSSSSPGRVFRYNGTMWAFDAYSTPQGEILEDIDMISANEGWLVGWGSPSPELPGVIIHYLNGTWTSLYTGHSLFQVDMVSANEGWAAGSDVILHYLNGTWSPAAIPVAAGYFDVRMLNANEGWAVGRNTDPAGPTVILHYLNGTWTRISAPTADPVVRIIATDSEHAWAFSENDPAVILYFEPGPVLTPTNTPTSTPTSTPTATATTCPITFTDVNPGDYFYEAVMYLACHGAISGYSDGTFRPYANTTRGQLSKIVVLAEGWPIVTPTGTPTFQDVPANNAFYTYIETAYARGVISGYYCGVGCLEFRWGNNVTRAQLAKIVVLASDWQLSPGYHTFRDVPYGDPFYWYVETAYEHAIISGYSCGTDCLEFRPGNSATRGQIAKIVYLAITSP